MKHWHCTLLGQMPPHFELLLQKHFNHSRSVSQIHALLITTGHFLSTPPTTFTYNCLIKCHPASALLLFTQMLARSLRPNTHTFPSLLKPASSPSAARSIHAQIFRRGLLLDAFTNCCLVGRYARFGLLADAQSAFHELPCPDKASCNSMLHAFCTNGDAISALSLFRRMSHTDIISWTTVINGLARNGMQHEALDIFRRLMLHRRRRQALRPNEATLVSVLSACADDIDLCHGKEIHAYVLRSEGQLTAFLGTALIDFYGKHGRLSSSMVLFESVEKKEACTWNAMISALARNGDEVEAIGLFGKMVADGRLRPDNVTFVVVLTACARRGLVDTGLRLFEWMRGEFGITPAMEHYGCIVDLLSRAGMLTEAWEFIRKMPMKPCSSVLGSLLGACKVHGDAAMGTEVGSKVVELQPSHAGRYMVLANIFAEAGRWDAAEELREGMEKAGVRKVAGCSWLDSGKTVVHC